MTQSRFFSSVAQPNSLQTNITGSTTAIPLANPPVGYPVNTPFTIALDYGDSIEELCDVTSVAGSVFNVTRAVDGTSAASHNVGAAIRHVSSARDFNEDNAHINTSTGVHGIAPGSSVVGTTDTQTLTNKTLVNPVFSGTIPFLSLGVSNPVGTRPLTIQSSTGQTASNLVIQNEAGTNVFGVSASGSVLLTSADTSNQNFFQVNPSAPTAASNLAVIQNSGSNRFTINSSGLVTAVFTGTGPAYTITNTNVAGGGFEVDTPTGAGSAMVFQAKLNGVSTFNVTAAGVGSFAGNLNSASLTVANAGSFGGGLTVTGGIGQMINLWKPSGTTRTSNATLSLDPDLQTTLVIGTYLVEGILVAGGGTAGAGNFKATWGGTALGTFALGMVGQNPTTATQVQVQTQTTAVNFDNSGPGVVIAKGTMIVTTGGTFGISWAQNTSNPIGTLLSIGSYLKITRVA